MAMNKIEIRGVEVGLGDFVSVDVRHKPDDLLLNFVGEVVSTQTDVFGNYKKIILCESGGTSYDLSGKGRMYHHLVCEKHMTDTFDIRVITPYEEKPALPKKCTCDITDMMRYGCRCGGV